MLFKGRHEMYLENERRNRKSPTRIPSYGLFLGYVVLCWVVLCWAVLFLFGDVSVDVCRIQTRRN